MISYQHLSKEQLLTQLEILEIEIQSLDLTDEMRRVTYNLSVYQIELEIQNRELQEMQVLLEESRNRYIDLYDFAPIGYLTFNEKGKILEVNLTASRMLALSRDKLLTQSFTSHVAPDERREFMQHITQVFQGGKTNVVPFDRRWYENNRWTNGWNKSQFNKEHNSEHSSEYYSTSITVLSSIGHEIDVQLESVLHFDVKDNTKYCHTMMIDVTEQKRLAVIKEKREGEFSRMSRLSALGEMATTFAHELTQPLYAVSTLAQTGTRLFQNAQPNKADIVEIFNLINQQALRAGELIRQIREYSRQSDIRRTSVKLCEVIDDAINLVMPSITDSLLDIQIQQDKIDSCVYVDKIQCEQVFVNILLNAIDVCKENNHSAHVISVKSLRPKGKFIEIQIADDGPGFVKEVENKIFDSFYTTKDSGMGMGLSICRTIIESFGGKIWAYNNRGTGTISGDIPGATPGATFCFTLPVDECA